MLDNVDRIIISGAKVPIDLICLQGHATDVMQQKSLVTLVSSVAQPDKSGIWQLTSWIEITVHCSEKGFTSDLGQFFSLSTFRKLHQVLN